MILLVDVGNTNIVFALVVGEEMLQEMRFSTSGTRTEDEYATFLAQALAFHDFKLPDIKGAAISCVVPAVLPALLRFFSKYCQVDALLVSPDNHNVRVGNMPSWNLGSDFAMNATAACYLYKNDCLIIDCGTVTTFAVLEIESLNYAGIAIAPGLHSMMHVLKHTTAQLPLLNFRSVDKILVTNTIEAMHAGVGFGFIGMVEKIIQQIVLEFQQPLQVVATGGCLRMLQTIPAGINIVEPNLTLLGLKYFYSSHGHRVKV